MSSRRRPTRNRSDPARPSNQFNPPNNTDIVDDTEVFRVTAMHLLVERDMGLGLHPVLTDYSARGCMEYVRKTFRQDQDLPPLLPLQQSLKAFADLLVAHKDIVKAFCNGSNESLTRKGKEPLRKAKEPVALKELEQYSNSHRRVPRHEDGFPGLLLDMNNDETTLAPTMIRNPIGTIESRQNTPTSYSAMSRAASFEVHASSSRFTARRRGSSVLDQSRAEDSTQRRRKTPAPADSSSTIQQEAQDRPICSAVSTTDHENPKLEEFEYEQLVPGEILEELSAFDQHNTTDLLLPSQMSEFEALQPPSPFNLYQEYQDRGNNHSINMDSALLEPSASAVLPSVLWDIGVLEYLSTADVKALRMTCKAFAEALAPWLFRSVVTAFGPELFNLRADLKQKNPLEVDHEDSMLKKYGNDINKFGISFEYDRLGLARAPYKHTSKNVDAWFGKYQWPMADYPYFRSLKRIDKLLDDEQQTLKQAMGNLTKCSELAISVDSGHGWLEGPDLSDLAILEERCSDGTKVFGKAFDAPDKAYEDSMDWLFRWAQIKTISELRSHQDSHMESKDDQRSVIEKLLVRSYDSFRSERTQPDFEPNIHTGGIVRTAMNGNRSEPGDALLAWNSVAQNLPASLLTRHRLQPAIGQSPRSCPQATQFMPIIPQWPLIFNGRNLSAECSIDTQARQEVNSIASKFPLLPSVLTEFQYQWLMETSWIQRTFISSYIEAVRVNAPIFRNVHSLHIAKLSSGLIPSISQRTFWTALPNLRKITLLIKPDWRVEHRPGDDLYTSSVQIRPIDTVQPFADLLRDEISRLETLNSLEIGYVSGGEHQKGLFGRNQHVLPAPVTTDPHAWLVVQNPVNARPDEDTMIIFPHVRTLTFTNCWFSPTMLEKFMYKSHDTSLYNLVLDSVSLTSKVHSSRADGPLRTIASQLQCLHSPTAWLNEEMPANASWATVLDTITPGPTILDMKYAANMIDENDQPRPHRSFRGNIQHINLKSCGYVMVKGVGSNDFNQNELVFQNPNWCALDDGLKSRASLFETWLGEKPAPAPIERPSTMNRRQPNNDANRPKTPVARPIMLSGRSGHTRDESIHAESSNTFMTGFLTQCIHPVEKRILERMWGMKFGWGDDMARWAAVEDGRFMGGTGRFSGEVFRDIDDQTSFNDAVAASIQRDIDEAERAIQQGKTVVHQAEALRHTMSENVVQNQQGPEANRNHASLEDVRDSENAETLLADRSGFSLTTTLLGLADSDDDDDVPQHSDQADLQMDALLFDWIDQL